MKIQIFSDPHLDYPGTRGLPTLIAGTQLVIVAGDVCQGIVNALTRLRQQYPFPTGIAFVAGNHEFYSRSWPEEIEAGRALARDLDIHFLERDVAIIGNVRVIGTTLWTDYDLLGEVLRDFAMSFARDMMYDHRRIRWQKKPWLRFRPEEARILHLQARDFIIQELSKPHNGTTLVVTHHAPLMDAIAPTFRHDLLSAAYASDLLPIIDKYQPDYWIYGHTHRSLVLQRVRTRIISNPIGYGDENALFDPLFALEGVA